MHLMITNLQISKYAAELFRLLQPSPTPQSDVRAQQLRVRVQLHAEVREAPRVLRPAEAVEVPGHVAVPHRRREDLRGRWNVQKSSGQYL